MKGGLKKSGFGGAGTFRPVIASQRRWDATDGQHQNIIATSSKIK
jgi:hypothetical protein